MLSKIIKTEKEYESACARVYELIHKDVEKGSKEGDEIELLALLIEEYEREHYPFDHPDPIEAIKFSMEQMELKPKDIAPLFGDENTVSEVLNGRRPLNISMIFNLNKYLKIPLESLINDSSNFDLKPAAKKKLLQNPNISKLLKEELVY